MPTIHQYKNMSSKIKLKATYGGYKEVAQFGLAELANAPYYQQITDAVGAPQQPVPIQQNNGSGAMNAISGVVGAVDTGISAFQKFQQMKGRLAYGIQQGIAGAAAIGNMFTETQLRREEREQKIQSLQGAAYENTNRGLNNIPAYTKYGGDLTKMKNGGDAKVRQYQEMLNKTYGANLKVDGAWGKNTQAAFEKFVQSQDKSNTNKPFDPFRQREDLSNSVIKRGAPKLPKDAQAIYDQRRFQGAPYSIVSKEDENIYNFDADGNLVLKDEVGLGKDRGDQAPVAFQKGKENTASGEYRITNSRSAAVDINYKGYDADNFYAIENTDPNKKIKGSPTNPKYKDATVAIHGIPKNLINNRLPLLNDPRLSNRMSSGCINCRKETLNNKYFTDLDREKYRLYVTDEPKRQNGGYGEPNVEAERGEVFQNNGDVLKIDDDANSHEQGGVNIQAEKVLENTSTLRKDPISKALKLDKEVISEMSGFKAKRGMSHSEAYTFEAKETANLQGKFLKAITKTIENPKSDKYAITSAHLNTELGLGQLPTENEIFDKYFNDQEKTKEDMGFYDTKLEAKYGKKLPMAKDGIINPYRKGKTKTPTGANSNFQGTNEDWKTYVDMWSENMGKNYDPNNYKGVYDLQWDAYNYSLENNPDEIRNMWKTYGLNEAAKQNGKDYDVNNLTDEQLLDLRSSYTDGLAGVRMLPPVHRDKFSPVEPITPRQSTQAAPALPTIPGSTPPLVPNETVPSTNTSPVINNPVKQGEFNQPMEWFDTLGPNMQILKSLRRDPELYNPVNIAQLKLQQQDVRPALQNSQAEYNAASANLGNDSVSAAQKAQMFSNKLRVDNQVIGQYENANKQIQNQETQYNTNARDRQEAANAQSRESFYTKVLQGRAKQEEQLLTGIDALAKTYAERRAFNNNANLLMKLAPNFNAKGEYNGVPATISSGGSNQPGVVTNTKGQPTVNAQGQYLLRTKR